MGAESHQGMDAGRRPAADCPWHVRVTEADFGASPTVRRKRLALELDTDRLWRLRQSSGPEVALRLPVEDLEVYERYGGHTLRRHVDPSPSTDAGRLANQPYIHGAGTFTDRAIAQWAVEATLRRHRPEVLHWLASGASGTLVIGATFAFPVGSELTREAWLLGRIQPAPARGVRVVLRRCDALPGGFLVLTAYPVLVLEAGARYHGCGEEAGGCSLRRTMSVSATGRGCSVALIAAGR
jgi:hypothetical protein